MLLENEERSKCASATTGETLHLFYFILITLILIG